MRTTLLISLSAVVLMFASYGLWKYTHPTSVPLDTALLEEHADQHADLAQVVSNQIEIGREHV